MQTLRKLHFVGIPENEQADYAVKAALDMHMFHNTIPHTQCM